jgi:hypothetical protein
VASYPPRPALPLRRHHIRRVRVGAELVIRLQRIRAGARSCYRSCQSCRRSCLSAWRSRVSARRSFTSLRRSRRSGRMSCLTALIPVWFPDFSAFRRFCRSVAKSRRSCRISRNTCWGGQPHLSSSSRQRTLRAQRLHAVHTAWQRVVGWLPVAGGCHRSAGPLTLGPEPSSNVAGCAPVGALPAASHGPSELGDRLAGRSDSARHTFSGTANTSRPIGKPSDVAASRRQLPAALHWI